MADESGLKPAPSNSRSVLVFPPLAGRRDINLLRHSRLCNHIIAIIQLLLPAPDPFCQHKTAAVVHFIARRGTRKDGAGTRAGKRREMIAGGAVSPPHARPGLGRHDRSQKKSPGVGTSRADPGLHHGRDDILIQITAPAEVNRQAVAGYTGLMPHPGRIPLLP